MRDNRSAFDSAEYDQKIIQTLPFYDEFFRQTVELVRTVCGAPLRWLDVGCGTGRMGSAAFDALEIERFVFTDASEAMVSIARERFGKANAEFAVCEAQDLPYENSFDVVTAIQVFHFLHEDGRRAALARCRRALRENGLFISFENFAPFTDTGTKVSLEKWRRYQMAQGKSAEESAGHIARYGVEYFPITVEEHLRLLRDCGFRTVEILWLSNMQAGFWAVK